MLLNMALRLRQGRTTSSALVENALAVADGAAATYVFTERFNHQARLQARAADLQRQAGSRLPYLGIPLTVKDNFDVAGFPTRAGSLVLKDSPATKASAPVVDRMTQAGFIVTGKTNMSEFAFSGLGLNHHLGTPKNPAFPNEERIPGGSSSGAAVSVALGIAPIALGTDTGGSIRIPAALCGLVGFKPSASAVSREGVLPLSTTLDSVGVIGRTVACCQAAFGILRDHGDGLPFPSNPQPVKNMRLAVIKNYVQGGMDATVSFAYERAIERLSAGGASITRLQVPELNEIPAINSKGTFSAAEAFAWHRDIIEAHAHDYDPRVLVRIRAGAAITAADYIRLTERRQWLINAVREQAHGYDALVMPTVPIIAPTFQSLEADEAYHHANLLMLRNPSIANLIDGCAISLPCHDEGEAPVGLTLMALHGQDDSLLRLAARVAPVIFYKNACDISVNN